MPERFERQRAPYLLYEDKTGQRGFRPEIRSFRGGRGFVSETRYIDIIKLFDRLLLAAVLLPLAGGVSAQSIADRFIGAYSAAE